MGKRMTRGTTNELAAASLKEEVAMRAERLLKRTAWGLSLILGEASALLGAMLTIGWILALALVIPPKDMGWGAGPQMLLPLGPPLIGFGLGLAGLVAARGSSEPVSRYSVAGLLLNAVPLALTVVLLVLKSMH
jgi:hypothetical protein